MPSNISKLLPLYLVIFIGFVGYSLMITVFTPMLLHSNSFVLPADISPAVVLGVLLALYPLGQFFSSPILGALSDRFGRKRVLMISMSSGLVCYGLIAISLTMNSLLLLMISLVLAGISEANVAMAQGGIADVSTEKERPHLFALINLAATLAYILGPLGGGQLASHVSDAAAFWGICVLLFVAILWIGCTFKETASPHNLTHIPYLKAIANVKNIFTDQRLRVPYLINFLLYLAMFGFFRCYPMYFVQQFHMNVDQVSKMIAWVSIPFIAISFGAIGFLCKRFSVQTLAMASAFFLGVSMLLLLIPQHMVGLLAVLLLPSLGIAICLPMSASLLSNRASAQEQGRVMGNNQAISVGAEAFSGLLSGLLAALFIPLPMIALAVVAFTASVFLFFSRNRAEDRVFHQAPEECS